MQQLLSSQQSAVFNLADPYAVSDYVNEHLGSHDIQLSRSRAYVSSLLHRKFASLDLCRISYGSDVRITSPALETFYHLQILLNGHCLWRNHRQEHYLGAGEMLIINPDDRVDLTGSADCEKFILKIPASVMESICRDQRWQTPGEGLRFVESCYRMDELEGFFDLLRMVCSEAETAEPMPRIQENYMQIVATKLLMLLRTNLTRPELNTSLATFEQIADYIRQNLKEDLCSDELARRAHMSPRSLYGLFERTVGLTPNRYIRQKKLERVHACLGDPTCGYRNVTELAMDYGFLHLGRFSEIYRRQFGELPTETLKRRQ
ncbi:AraC family transcriptional regulator [Pseudomonas sp. REP124]|nr:AraC family transcriptional regulator [Pseudomonas sp. REP124]